MKNPKRNPHAHRGRFDWKPEDNLFDPRAADYGLKN
jgi:hypothetical protein